MERKSEEEYVLQTRGLSKQFKKSYAVKDLSMAVRKNSVYGLLGPNVPRYILKV